MDRSSDEFMEWICSIEQEKYLKYKSTLRSAFKRDGIDGLAITDIDKNDCSIQQERYIKYENALRAAFKLEDIDGSAIGDIDKNDLKGWGIQSFKDRTSIHKQLQNLLNQNNHDNQVAAAYNANDNEGGDKTEYH